MTTRAENIDLKSGILEDAVREQVGFSHSTLSFIGHTKNSALFLLVNQDGKKYFVKIPQVVESAILQYESLTKAYSAFEVPDLKIPEPLFIIPEIGAYCIDYIEGPNLKSIITRFPGSAKNKHEAVTDSGRWIKHFHQSFFQEYQHFNFDKNLQEFTVRIDEASGSQSLHSLEKQVADWLFKNYDKAKTDEISWGKCHGDFKSDNIIISDKETFGVDFFIYQNSNQFMDLIQFQNNVLLLQFQSAGLRFGTTADKLMKIFFRAYFDDDRKVPINVLSWLHVYRLLDLWQSYRKHGSLISRGRASFISGKLGRLIATDL